MWVHTCLQVIYCDEGAKMRGVPGTLGHELCFTPQIQLTITHQMAQVGRQHYGMMSTALSQQSSTPSSQQPASMNLLHRTCVGHKFSFSSQSKSRAFGSGPQRAKLLSASVAPDVPHPIRSILCSQAHRTLPASCDAASSPYLVDHVHEGSEYSICECHNPVP